MINNEFYKPLQNFIDFVENTTPAEQLNSKPIISKKIIDSLNMIWYAMEKQTYYESIKIIEIINDDKLLNQLFKLNLNLTYSTKKLESTEYLKELININNINPKIFLFIRYYPKNIKYESLLAINFWSYK